MKIDFETRLRRLAVSVLAAAAFLVPTAVLGKTYFTVKELLLDQFGAAEKVGYERIELDTATRERIERRLHRKLPKGHYTFYVASKGGQPYGYALFDEELGQHEMISLATFFDATGNVTRVEVTAYREPYGDGVRSLRFRKQFEGRDADSGFRPGRDIDVISGATISTHSMCRAVERAAVLLDAVVLER